jgi:hypothetical protein
VALALAARNTELRPRALLLFLLALGSLIPATYECYLCNRVRYLWPFAPAWFVGAAVLSKFVGTAFARLKSELEIAGSLVLGGFVGALAGKLPGSLDDLAVSARAIFDQQASLGLWAEKKLPNAASIGVNDTGAIAYFSGRRTFDVVGLTTAGEARYWTAGAGSRFEHYERLGQGRLPSHFIVYPEWFALEPLLGQELTERYVPGATILGGPRMVAYEADYTLLGSGHTPAAFAGRHVVDRFDVADLESEAAHGYELDDAQKDDNVVRFAGARVDGGRRNRHVDSFWLDVVPRGKLLLRVASEMPTELEITIGHEHRKLEAPFDFGDEVWLEVPERLAPGRTRVRVQGLRERFTSLHYFSLAP